MTDEKHAFIEDVTERGAISRQSGTRYAKAGKSSACDLPHDHLTRKQLQALHGEEVTVNLKKPIEYTSFMKLSDDTQKEYLHKLLDTYGATAERIGAMWSISASKVTFFFKKFNIVVPYNNRYKKTVWETFLTSASEPELEMEADDNSETKPTADALVFSEEIPRKPISRAEFDALSPELKKEYISFLKDGWHFTNTQIASMWKCSNSRIAQLTKAVGWKPTFKNHWAMATSDEFQKWLSGNAFDIDVKMPTLCGRLNKHDTSLSGIDFSNLNEKESEPSKEFPVQEEPTADIPKVGLTAIDGVEINGNLDDILNFLKPILGTGEWHFTISARKD